MVFLSCRSVLGLNFKRYAQVPPPPNNTYTQLALQTPQQALRIAICQCSIGIAVACRTAWLCTQRRPSRRFWGMCLPQASSIATWIPSGHAGHGHHAGASGFSAVVVRALRTAHAGCVARIHSSGQPSWLYFTSRAHRTLKLVLHGHVMHNPCPSQPYNARCVHVVNCHSMRSACLPWPWRAQWPWHAPGRPHAHH